MRRLTVEVPSLPPGMESLRLVHVSDMHLGGHTGKARLLTAARLIRHADPHLLLSSGDLVDLATDKARPLAGLLSELRPPLGKFAVLGNHEFWGGLEANLAFLASAGFGVLRGASVRVADGLLIAGVDDPAGRRRRHEPTPDEEDALPEEGGRPTTILLKHQPRVRHSSLGRFDLQLSGHTHGGQLFPWHLVTARQYRYWRGLYTLPDGSHVHVSRGAGTWGPPIRFLARPEVTLITLRRRPPRQVESCGPAEEPCQSPETG